MTIHRILGALALILALGVGLPSAMAHPPDEHVPGEPAATSAGEPPVATEPHDDAGAQPHDHGDHDDTGSAPHEHGAPAVADHHGPDAVIPASANHHAGEDDGAVVDHHRPAEEPGGHAHWGDNGPQTDMERAIAKTGALHSVAVHFPIALILVAALGRRWV